MCFLSSGNRTTTPCYSLYSWEKMHVPLFVSFFAVEKFILLLVTFISSACVCSFLSFLMSSDWWHSLTIFFSFFSGNGKDIEPSPCLQFSACSCPECIRQCSQWHEKRVLCWWFSSCCRFLKRKVSPHYEYNYPWCLKFKKSLHIWFQWLRKIAMEFLFCHLDEMIHPRGFLTYALVNDIER